MKYKMMTAKQELSFFQVPLALLSKDLFPDLSTDAAVVYSLLLNLTGLSIKTTSSPGKCFEDADGRIYIIYPSEDIADWLGFTKSKTGRLLRSLESCGLILRKRIGMDNTIHIYVKDFSAALDKNEYDREGDFPFFTSMDQIDAHHHIRVPFAMLKDSNLKSLPIKAIILYNYLRDKMGLSRKNKERFTDSLGRLYIFASLDEIHNTLRVGKNAAADLLNALDDVGLIHREKEKECDGGKRFSNKYRIYVCEYIPSEEMVLQGESVSQSDKDHVDNENSGDHDEGVSGKKAQNKVLKPLKIKEITKLKHRKLQNQDIGNDKNNTSEITKLNYQKLQNQAVGDYKIKPSEMPKQGINLFTDSINPNLLKDPIQFNSYQKANLEKGREGIDSPFQDDFYDEFCLVIERDAILPSTIEQDYPSKDEWKQSQIEHDFITSLIREVTRTLETNDSLTIDGVSYSRDDLKKELLSIDASIFLEGIERIKNVGKSIKRWGPYTISVLLQVKRTYILDQINKIAIFEKKLKEL